MECWGSDNEATAEISFISKFLTVSGANCLSLSQLFLCTVTEITPTAVIYWLVKDETDRQAFQQSYCEVLYLPQAWCHIYTESSILTCKGAFFIAE